MFFFSQRNTGDLKKHIFSQNNKPKKQKILVRFLNNKNKKHKILVRFLNTKKYYLFFYLVFVKKT